MMNRAGGLSLRATLMLIAAAGAVYVAGISLLITFRVAPAAKSLQGRSIELIALHDEASGRVRALKASIAVGIGALRQPPQRDSNFARAWRRQVGFQLDSVAALTSSRRMSDLLPEDQLAFGRAADDETDAGLLLFEAATALELGYRGEVGSRLIAADSALVVTGAQLDAIQRRLIEAVGRREGTLVAAARVVGRAVYWWLALGLLLFAIAVVIVNRRLRRPLAELETALVEVGKGNLRVQAHPRRRDELGLLAEHFNTMTDVLRVRADEARRRQDSLAERLAQVFDEATDGIYVFDADSLAVLQANRGLGSTLGYSDNELIQRSALDLVVPDGRQEIQTLLGQLRRGTQERAVLATSLVRADGSSFPVELSLRYSAAGAPPVFLAVAEDMSPRERTYELNEKLRRFALEKNRVVGGGDLGQALPELTQLVANALRVERVSVWEYAGPGIRLLDLFERTGARHARGTVLASERYPEYFQALTHGEPIVAFDVGRDPRTAGLCPDYFGPACVGATLDVPVFAGGKLRGVVCSEHSGAPRRWAVEEVMFMSSVADLVAIAMEAADRTRAEEALRESEAQLAHAQKMDSIGRLAGGVAHDFNNLLTAIMGHLELARWDSPPKGELAEHLRQIEHAAHRASDLTRQLLTFARRQVVEPRVVDVNELTRHTDRMLRRLIGADIALMSELDPDLWPVRLDPGQFEQVIVNLAVNARDAMPAGGVLTIATRNLQVAEPLAAEISLKPGPYVEIAVRDTGRGISPEVLPRIFEPFFTTKELGRGTGLGLATCYGIVQQAGGDIGVESAVGKGTTFRIYLPRTDEPLAAPALTEVHLPAPPGRETILLVEDEPQVLELTADVLRAQGYMVLTATDGAQGLAIGRANAGRINLLLSDLVMPSLGGRELAAMLQEEQPALACLLMSGYTPESSAIAQLDRSRQAFIAKPFTLTELARRVREVLDRRQA